jgi:hypothetical protein
MAEWALIQWSQARQVTQTMGIKDAQGPAAGVTPGQHFTSLVQSDKLTDAVQFLAHALPRYEAVQWAANAMGTLRPAADRDLDEARAFDTAHQWLRDPDERLRRTAEALAETMEEPVAEKLLLQAIFLSGGSIAPEDLPPVHPRPDTTAKLAGAAILLSAFATPEPQKALTQVLQDGEKLAARVS